jgi:hypothetical protein
MYVYPSRLKPVLSGIEGHLRVTVL